MRFLTNPGRSMPPFVALALSFRGCDGGGCCVSWTSSSSPLPISTNARSSLNCDGLSVDAGPASPSRSLPSGSSSPSVVDPGFCSGSSDSSSSASKICSSRRARHSPRARMAHSSLSSSILWISESGSSTLILRRLSDSGAVTQLGSCRSSLSALHSFEPLLLSLDGRPVALLKRG